VIVINPRKGLEQSPVIESVSELSLLAESEVAKGPDEEAEVPLCDVNLELVDVFFQELHLPKAKELHFEEVDLNMLSQHELQLRDGFLLLRTHNAFTMPV